MNNKREPRAKIFMKDLRGQVTIFIIIAIVIVGAVVAYFAFKGNLGKSGENSFSEADNVKTFTESCIEETAINVAYDVGLGGGYYFPPQYSTESGIVYYHNADNLNHFPSLSFVEEQISIYVSENLPLCTKNFALFRDLNISRGAIETTTSIQNNKFVVNVKYPLTISKGNMSALINGFNNIEVPIRLGIIYNSANEISDYSYQDSGICINCIFNVSEKNSLNVSMTDYGNDSTIFVISDSKDPRLKNDSNFEWVFATKYKNIV